METCESVTVLPVGLKYVPSHWAKMIVAEKKKLWRLRKSKPDFL